METRKEHTYQPIASEREYYDLEHRSEIREGARKLRRDHLQHVPQETAGACRKSGCNLPDGWNSPDQTGHL